MPVSSQQLEYAKGIVDALSENPRTGEPAYTRMKRIKPKGFRGSILKHIGWPTSWAVLYDLSPAQISQNREAEKAREVWGFDSDRLDRVSIWKVLLRGYFYNNPDPMSEANFPSWRKPSWMSEANAQSIRALIVNAYENEGLRQRADGEVSLSAEQVADAPLAQTMPVEDVPREQRMADLAEQEEAEAVQIEEEQAETEGDGGRSLIENLYELYQPYWRRSHNVESRSALYDRRGNAEIRKALIAILTLEKLGYEYRGIRSFTKIMGIRSIQIFGLRRATRSGYNAYLVVELKGANANASRYRSATAYQIMAETCRAGTNSLKEQFEPSTGRGLQPMRFTGRGNSLGGLQVLSLNVLNGVRNTMTMQEGNRKFSTANNESIAQLDAGTSSTETTTTTQVEDSTSRQDVVFFIGFQSFAEGLTYQQSGEFNISLNKFPEDVTRSYIFYFAKPNAQGSYDLSRSTFGPLNADPRIRRQPNSTDRLAQLKLAWNASGRLTDRNSLILTPIPVRDKRQLRASFVAQFQAGLDTRGRDFPVTRVNAPIEYPTPFAKITAASLPELRKIAVIFEAMAGVEESDSGPTSTMINLLNTNQCRILSESPYSFGFGIEFEGFVRQGTRKELSENLRAEGVKVYSTKGYQSATPVRGEEQYVEGHRWRQEADSSVTGYQANTSGGYDPSGEGQTFEMVSVILNESVDNKSGNNDWIPEIEQYCTALAKHGVLIDPSSGIHIHVGYKNFDAQQTKNFFINSVLMLPVLKGLVSEAWKGRGYAKFPSTDNLQRKLSDIANAGNTQDAVVNAYRRGFGEARYSWLNTVNFGSSRKPTFEYRFQGSSIEKDTMVNTIKILQQIWKASLEGIIPIQRGAGKSQDQVLINLLGQPLFAFARNRYAETELPNATSRTSNSFKGFDFPISASQIT